GLAGARGADEQDVGLLQLDVPSGVLLLDPLVVVVDGDSEDLLGPLLADHVLVESRLDLGRPRDPDPTVLAILVLDLLRDDVVAEADALVADVDRWPRDELLDLLLRLSAEGTAQGMAVAPVQDHLSCRGHDDPGIRL